MPSRPVMTPPSEPAVGPTNATRGAEPAEPGPPRIWVILSDKLGDNAQIQAIAAALPWSCEERRILMRSPYVLGKPAVTASLHHVDRARSDPLEPPWPDLVITIGRRMSMVALWIQQQSGGATRLVLVGRPRRYMEHFALIVTSAQYRMPERPNILHLRYPLMRQDETAIAGAARAWSAEFAALNRPISAVMLGGPTKSLRFDGPTALALADGLAAMAARDGGTIIATTSRRTPSAVAEALAAALPPSARLYPWVSDGRRNPYTALLGLADRFVVTGDSVSMLIEVARLGRPLAIYPLPSAVSLLERPLTWLQQRRDPVAGGGEGWLPRCGELLYRLGVSGYLRDLAALHELMIGDGLAVPFGQPFPAAPLRVKDELPVVIERIVGLLRSD